ncbi:acylphosphatase [Candidatus Micrarchaeota archaeon]|jgi:acylphosphatase|nr:acylphosphatase [Candidatus Micrarchaeota archaeon]
MYELIIEGRVQGVFFRAYVKDIAIKMDVRGYVENMSDGTVRIIGDLNEQNLSEFIDKIYSAPLPIRTNKILISKTNEEYYDSKFIIKH